MVNHPRPSQKGKQPTFLFCQFAAAAAFGVRGCGHMWEESHFCSNPKTTNNNSLSLLARSLVAFSLSLSPPFSLLFKEKMQNPDEDTEWNDILRAKGILPEKEVEVTEDDLAEMVRCLSCLSCCCFVVVCVLLLMLLYC